MTIPKIGNLDQKETYGLAMECFITLNEDRQHDFVRFVCGEIGPDTVAEIAEDEQPKNAD